MSTWLGLHFQPRQRLVDEVLTLEAELADARAELVAVQERAIAQINDHAAFVAQETEHHERIGAELDRLRAGVEELHRAWRVMRDATNYVEQLATDTGDIRGGSVDERFQQIREACYATHYLRRVTA